MVRLHKEMRLEEPQILKKVITRQKEEVLLRYPDLCPLLKSIGDSYSFSLEPNLRIRAIETPGHKADHMSYMLE